jgi:hypothetical protein
MNWAAASAIAAAVSATAAAASAVANWWNTTTFIRQLRNTTVDASLTTAFALQAAVHKTIEHRLNQLDGVDNITAADTRAAYDDAWPKWVAFHQAYRIAQRYSPGLGHLEPLPPDKAAELLTELRISLRNAAWRPGGADDPKDIRKEADEIVKEMQKTVGLAEGRARTGWFNRRSPTAP